MNEPSTPRWRKSSYSNGAGGECVEVAELGSVVGVRDSKQPLGPQLAVHTDAWAGFVSLVRNRVPTGSTAFLDRVRGEL